MGVIFPQEQVPNLLCRQCVPSLPGARASVPAVARGPCAGLQEGPEVPRAPTSPWGVRAWLQRSSVRGQEGDHTFQSRAANCGTSGGPGRSALTAASSVWCPGSRQRGGVLPREPQHQQQCQQHPGQPRERGVHPVLRDYRQDAPCQLLLGPQLPHR